MEKGRAFLVGAGPGDVQLITVKGLEAIKKAQVILYDRLANPKLLDYAPQDCELIYCGKLPDRHVLRQEMINDLLVSKVLEGKNCSPPQGRRSWRVWTCRRRSSSSGRQWAYL
ncbi:SAM-dependent methyltransferase [Mesobacillus subterraneus]|uniref:uroporphyrinogen-III C-methyltransferase n=1 Tax=Mesobacillus subterraneus TaxID=285983 RepID=UPI00273EEA66|nr:SAM-dependent methyltransferase [Mesobacillus subterraneus]WLR54131.1 SAM-dependent methyltransferase [Mesobacillus subterraneus]